MTRRSAIATLVAALALIVAVATTSTLRTSTPSAAPATTEPIRADHRGAGRRGPRRRPRRRPNRPRRRRNASRPPSRRGRQARSAFRPAPWRSDPAPGWSGEYVLNAAADDWEPAIAADPNAPYVYVLATRYAAKPCAGNCPTPWMALAISKDGGATWGKQRPLCACKGSGQFDPIIEVAPDTGAVYALYMNGYNVVFIRSTDHGKTWSDPVPTYGKVSWNDKPVLAVSDDGRDVYASWNGPKGGDPWLAQSHDAGKTWTQTRLASTEQLLLCLRRGRDVERAGGLRGGSGDVRKQHGPGRVPPRSTPSSPTIEAQPGATSSWTRSRRRSPARTAGPTTTRVTWP